MNLTLQHWLQHWFSFRNLCDEGKISDTQKDLEVIWVNVTQNKKIS